MGVEDLNPIYKTHLISKLSSSRTSTNSLTLHPIINSMIQTSLSSTPHLTVFKRFHFGHSHCHHDEHYGGVEADQVFRLGVAADIALASGKVLTGNLSKSTAIIVDAAHSLSDVEVIDTSGGCGASFEIAIVSEQFKGKRLLERHGMVNFALAEEMKEIHALSIPKALTLAQWK